MGDQQNGLVEALTATLHDVERTEASHTRNPGTDYRCRQWFVSYGRTALAALSQPDAQAVPEGWKLVPISPTQAMLDAGYYPAVQNRGAKSVWQEMLAASPATGGPS